MSSPSPDVEQELEELRKIDANIDKLNSQLSNDVNQTVQFMLAAEPSISKNIQKISNDLDQLNDIAIQLPVLDNIDQTLNKFLTAIALLFIILALAVLVIGLPLLNKYNCSNCFGFVIIIFAVTFLLFLAGYFLYC